MGLVQVLVIDSWKHVMDSMDVETWHYHEGQKASFQFGMDIGACVDWVLSEIFDLLLTLSP